MQRNKTRARARVSGLALAVKLALAAVVGATPALACAQGGGAAAPGPLAEEMESPPATQPTIVGRWSTPDQEATIQIYLAKDGALYGKLVAAKDPKAKMGTLILRKLQKKGSAWKGQLYAPKKDRTADVTVRLDGARLALEVSAGFRDKTIYWTRAVVVTIPTKATRHTFQHGMRSPTSGVSLSATQLSHVR